MPEIPQRFEFLPSKDTRMAWLSTRKSKIPGGTIELPGFYQTVDFNKDRNWFVFAMFIEILAVILTLYGGFSKGGVYLIASIVAVLLFVVFDIVGSIWSHKHVAVNCLNLNMSYLCGDNEGARKAYLNEVKMVRPMKILGISCIVFSAILKIAAILALGRFILIFYVKKATYELRIDLKDSVRHKFTVKKELLADVKFFVKTIREIKRQNRKKSLNQ